ncbi:MAG: cupredoxin family protein [Micropepsaceae bacterium]
MKFGKLAALIAFVAPSAPNSAMAHADHEASAYGHPGEASRVSRTIKVEMTEYAFSLADLSVNTGETVKFVISNHGKLKHEMTIGSEAEQLIHRKEMEAMSDMGHDEGKHEMPDNALHLAPGETKEVIWQFTKAGKIEFACNYPGHADLGMLGNISIE